MAGVTLRNVKKVYENGVEAVQDFSLEIADKEFVVLVGPSGCGKSTTLRMIAGLESITAGELYIGDRLVNAVPPKDRDISMVFQNYALFPHLTVYENMAFPLKMRHFPKRVIDEKVTEAAAMLDISELLKRKPKALSGGQRQRVAIGRAIVRDPSVFLMDEPLSNLDAKLRNQMRMELVALRERVQTTFVYVTHDQIEAMTLGDRIVVMRDGVIQQVGSPDDVYAHPANAFVAGFIGTPQMNLLPAELRCTGGIYSVSLSGVSLPLGAEAERALTERAAPPQSVTLGIRPESVELLSAGARGLPAALSFAERLGGTVNLHAAFGAGELVLSVPAERAPRAGSILTLGLPPEAIRLFDPQSGASLF
ncbi:MAG: sn-glycerol-3-phosphate ABC transporter ATP-binding protein UgpC [Oscillospiraceae bacterium]|nr:sn-glycerol-3-phosphate ABC transporter ATP-binding protein UgpC [Oscillospiraceae bacterium]